MLREMHTQCRPTNSPVIRFPCPFRVLCDRRRNAPQCSQTSYGHRYPRMIHSNPLARNNMKSRSRIHLTHPSCQVYVRYWMSTVYPSNKKLRNRTIQSRIPTACRLQQYLIRWHDDTMAPNILSEPSRNRRSLPRCGCDEDHLLLGAGQCHIPQTQGRGRFSKKGMMLRIADTHRISDHNGPLASLKPMLCGVQNLGKR